MKDELILFETAVLAKEKGFDIKTDNVYLQYFFGDIASRSSISSPYGSCKDLKGVYFQPTQSLLQKWLREVHSLHISIELRYSGDDSQRIGWYYNIEKFNIPYILQQNQYKFEWLDSGNQFNEIYENALEEGLKKALNLIKNENSL